MSWSRGSELMSEIISILKLHVPDDDIRKTLYDELVPLFEDYDCDTLYECANEDEMFDEVLKERREEYDQFFEDEE